MSTLTDQLVAAIKAESTATDNMLAAAKAGIKDMATIESLCEKMIATHNAKMDVVDLLKALMQNQGS